MAWGIKKSLTQLLSEESGESALKRTLGSGSILLFALGAVSGAGLFMRIASAIAYHAGGGVVISFLIAAAGCGLAALCYAEMASMIPVAGGAYTYVYSAVGEELAWIVGWDLILEYALGSAAIAIAFSEYLNHLLESVNLAIPYVWSHSPWQHGIVNLPAIAIIVLLILQLRRGTQESVGKVGWATLFKFAAIIIFISAGWQFTHPVSLPAHELIPDAEGMETHFGGWQGILGAAGIVFFTFIGFDAISTTAQESKDPSKDLPRGILGAVVFCAVVFTLFAFVMYGITTVKGLRSAGHEASVSAAVENMAGGAKSHHYLSIFLTIAALSGFIASMLTMLFGQARVLYSLSRDGLLPKILSRVHPKYRTPVYANMAGMTLCLVFAGLVPLDVVGEITSIGTLFTFMLICICTWIVRKRAPHMPRPFKVPALPAVVILSVVICGAMIFGLGWTNWLRLGIWLIFGLIIYFTYGRKRSRARNEQILLP